MRCAILTLAFGLTACTQFPALDGAVSEHAAQAQYPALAPVDPILAQAASGSTPAQTTNAVTSRVSALRTRANRLRGRVIDPTTRQRMRAGVPQG